ncbi:uncharacterized protein LOC123904535 [Trifolium pratense]|uniref:uncharacterized protein LOC123904535 n=1 Tax=Trifolium pratense TaxID=57577 RepID=UPI001E696DA4|nr:uncharacterized protein LOC123904535 [Trifolium pratense]
MDFSAAGVVIETIYIVIYIVYAPAPVRQPYDMLIISINAAGAVIETIYIVIYIIYAPAPARRFTIILLIAMIVGLFAPIFLAIQFFVAKKNHVTVLGWICTSVSIAVFAAPLSAVIHVVRTRRVEIFFLTHLFIYLFINSLITALLSFSCSSQFILPIQKDPLTKLFYTSLSIGTPQHNFNLVIDLGGPILWYDCNKTYNSSTYTPLSCDSKLCPNDAGCTSCDGPLKPGCTNNTCGANIINTLANSIFSGDTGNDVMFISHSKISGLFSGCTNLDAFSDNEPLKGLPKTSKGRHFSFILWGTSTGIFNHSQILDLQRVHARTHARTRTHTFLYVINDTNLELKGTLERAKLSGDQQYNSVTVERER